MRDHILRSSSQLLLLFLGFITSFIAFTVGEIQSAGYFLVGNWVSIMFVNVSDPTQYSWALAQVAGLFADMKISDSAASFLSHFGAWTAVLVISALVGVVYTLLQTFLRKVLYGNVLTGRSGKYLKYTFLLNTIFAISFFTIGYHEFMSSPPRSFYGVFGEWYGSILFPPFFAFFVMWWLQHILNLYACGIKITAETVSS